MIDKFRSKFVEESLDNVNDLEEALFLLEKDTKNKEIIERIFRAMHSLKGGGAMFGFNDLSEFTHNLETVFDMVRNNKLDVDHDIISLTFASIDHIKRLLELGDLKDPADIREQKLFIERVNGYIKGQKSSGGTSISEVTKIQADEGWHSYLITIKPGENLLNNGTNPFFLIDDLTALGESKTLVFVNRIPSFEQLHPLNIYVDWQVVLYTDQQVNDIKDVFIFVEDDCKIDIVKLPDGRFIDSEQLTEIIDKSRVSEQFLTASDFEIFKAPVETTAASSEGDAIQKAQSKDHKISSIRVSSKKIDELVNAVSELVTLQAQLNLVAEKSGNPAITAMAENIQKITRQLRDNAFEVSLIPLQSELMRFQRLVRDLSKEMKKDIDFIIEGGDIELDKNIIEHLTDPLLHILRNCVDHGIELPEDRLKAGKSPKGTVVFKAYYSGSSVIIKVADDGKGLDPNMILQKAIKKGIVDEKVELSEQEIFNLVFVSGFSTKDKVSDVSGRGVGMDVVKNKIGEIRGEVSIESTTGKGTTLTLELPLTLSIIDGLLILVGGRQYVIPIANIERIFATGAVIPSKGVSNSVVIGDEQFACINLREVFHEEIIDMKTQQLLLVNFETRKVGIMVDKVVGEFQTVVKPLGRYLRKIDIISGASVMGDGSMSLVLDTNRLIQHSSQRKYRSN
jgi:two-component system chemotaxis sensor kinase CheA